MRYIVLLIITVIFIIAAKNATDVATTKAITYNDFVNLLEKNQISKVVITKENLLITPSENNEEYKGKTLYTANINDGNLVSQLREAKVNFEGKNTRDTPISNLIFSWIIPLGIIVLIWKYYRIRKENQYLLNRIKDLLENKDN